jgi:hypothetical protein
MPGWAPLIPIRQFILEVKRRNPGRRSENQLNLALEWLGKLRQGNAGYFAGNPAAARHFDSLINQDRVYLVHEYLDEHWNHFQFGEVAARFAEAKLSFLCSATIPDNINQYTFTKDLLPLANATDDAIMRELVRDFSVNTRFRRDIFARGTAALTAPEHRRLLDDLRFALAVPRNRVSFQFGVSIGQVAGLEQFYGPIADLLAQKVASFGELLALPVFGQPNIRVLLDCLALLVHSTQVLPITMPPADAQAAQRFNRMVVDNARLGRFYSALATPVARTGIGISDIGLLALAALFDGVADEPAAAAKASLALLEKLGRWPMKEGKIIENTNEALGFLEASLQPILTENVPIWRRLGMI